MKSRTARTLAGPLALVGLVLASHAALSGEASPGPDLTTLEARTSYAIGVDIGRNFRATGLEYDLDALVAGLTDALEGRPLDLTAHDIRILVKKYYNDAKRSRVRRQQVAGMENRAAEVEFLARNKDADGVVTLPSGLQYRVLRQGDGPRPTVADTVVCHFRSSLLGGMEIDSSYPTGAPAQLVVDDVIPGLKDALTRMPVGSHWVVYIPSAFAYGPKPVDEYVEPNSLIVFDIDLVDVR